RQETKPDPALIDDPRQPHRLDTAIGGDIADQWPPQAVSEEPQWSKQGRPPGKAVLDEDEAFGTVDAVGRGVRRLVHGEGLHGLGRAWRGGWKGLLRPGRRLGEPF